MSSIVFFPSVLGERYYLTRHVSKQSGHETYQLVCEREEASTFADDKAQALARVFNGHVRPSDWEEDETKVCIACRVRKSVFEFHSAASKRYPHLRRSYCKECDHRRRAEYRRS